MKKRTVALYSRNTVLSTIGACLQKNTVFQVEQIDGPSEIIGKVSPPDVILFDFETAQPHFFLSMMRDHPRFFLRSHINKQAISISKPFCSF